MGNVCDPDDDNDGVPDAGDRCPETEAGIQVDATGCPLPVAPVASGPSAFDELRKVLAGTHAEVNQLFKDKRLDKYCGDRNDAPPDQCHHKQSVCRGSRLHLDRGCS